MSNPLFVKFVLLFIIFQFPAFHCWAFDKREHLHVSFQKAEDELSWLQFVEQKNSTSTLDEQIAVSQIEQMKALTQAGHEMPLYCYAVLQNNLQLIQFLKRSGVAIEKPLVTNEDYLLLSPEWASDLYCVAFLYGENNSVWYDESINIYHDTLKAAIQTVNFSQIREIELFAIFNAALQWDDVALMKLLIQQGFPLEFKDEFGSNLLMHALWSHAYGISELLIDNGAPTFAAREIGDFRISDPKKLVEVALNERRENPAMVTKLERIKLKLNQNK